MQKGSFVFMSVLYDELHSPNYPEHYSAPLDKDWHLQVPLGYYIQLNFNYLNIKASQDCRNYSFTVNVICDTLVLSWLCSTESLKYKTITTFIVFILCMHLKYCRYPIRRTWWSTVVRRIQGITTIQETDLFSYLPLK